MQPCSSRSSIALFSVLLAAMLVGAPARAQQTAPPPAASDDDTLAIPPGATADTVTPAQLADIAGRGIVASNLITEKYTYVETEHIQNYIDGTLQVDHTTVTENIFIHNLPYMRRLSVDGQPLAGKELKRETALYEQAVKQRTALDEAVRANMMRHALRTTSRTELEKLPAHFKLAVIGHEDVDGHNCVILDATPKDPNPSSDLARHIRMDIEPATFIVLNIRIEFLADDGGFSQGSVLDTHYTLIAGVPLATHQTWDTTVSFKELLNKKIRIHRDIIYSNYRRFHATATIRAYVEAPADTASTSASSPAAAAVSTTNPDGSAKSKAQIKADQKAAQDAAKKAKAEFKAQEKAKAADAAKASGK